MTRDTTLDAFAGTSDASPVPIETTMVWDPAGRPCGDCGERVKRSWRDEDALHCTGCREWNRI